MTVGIITTCPVCGKVKYVYVEDTDYMAWQNGELCQNAFPYLSASERESLISGICDSCWNSMFNDDDDDFIDNDDFIDDDEPYDLEMGFDCYEGCYTYDC